MRRRRQPTPNHFNRIIINHFILKLLFNPKHGRPSICFHFERAEGASVISLNFPGGSLIKARDFSVDPARAVN